MEYNQGLYKGFVHKIVFLLSTKYVTKLVNISFTLFMNICFVVYVQ
jgi:hypothetical protein